MTHRSRTLPDVNLPAETDIDPSEIAQLAYELYEARQRSGIAGSADTDWFHAEAEIRRRLRTSESEQ